MFGLDIGRYYTSVVRSFPFHTPTEMVQATHRWCAERLARHPIQTLLLPAGNTPKALYAFWETHHPTYLAGLRFAQVDELLDSGTPPLFQRFFRDELPTYASRIRPPGQLVLNNSLAILGLGRNGHVAFHEPHLPADFSFGHVRLAPTTCEALGVKPPARGRTYGLATLMKSKSVLLLVAGSGKEKAWQSFVANDDKCPAAHLRSHADLTVLYSANLDAP